MRIADAANTYNYALAAIFDKGFKVFLYPHPYDEGKFSYWAIKEDRQIVASDPLALLGLIGVWERFGDDWRQKIPRYDSQLFEMTFPDDDYESLDEQSFEKIVQDLRIFFRAIDEPMPDPLTRKNLAEFMGNFSRMREERANND